MFAYALVTIGGMFGMGYGYSSGNPFAIGAGFILAVCGAACLVGDR
jgi:hypothetical protein